MQQVPIISVLLLTIVSACHSGGGKKESGKNMVEVSVPIVVTADIEEGIKANIDKKVEEGNGYFHMITEEGENLRLQLVRVHTEYLANLGPRRHFACVDLADVSGDVYDVDFFMEGDPGDMMVTETSLHKLNGRPFYSWKQDKDKTWHRTPVETASSDLLGVKEGTDAFEFYYEVTLPEMDEPAVMWIPIAGSDEFQQVERVSLVSPGNHSILEEAEYGNEILHMELSPEHSGEKVTIVYDVERREKHPYEEDTLPGRYLDPNLLLPVDDRFKFLADSIIAAENVGDNRLMQARALYDHIIDNMRYMKFGTYGTGDAAYACDALTGNCTEFHSYFISLARSAGIPARFAIGASIPSERDEGGIDGYHCWAEFYAEGKWWPVDISEANKYTALATYYFGRHPANRIELSRGRDLLVEPGPATGPINFLAFPILEVGDKPVTPHTFFSFKRKGKGTAKTL